MTTDITSSGGAASVPAPGAPRVVRALLGIVAGVPRRAADEPEPTTLGRLGGPPRTPLLVGLLGSVLIVLGGFGAGGVPVRDPVLTNSALGFWRYGHGYALALVFVYGGLLLMAYAWVRLGRGVLAQRVGGRAVLTSAAVWTLPMMFAPPLFTRDVFSYLAQGAIPLAGLDPYAVGPEAIPGLVQENVHPVWQDTPAPYGPLFILIAKGVAAVSGDDLILGVILMRLVLLSGLALLIWALPELCRRMGGRIPVTLWIAIANPVMVVHMIGGIHNDLLVVGLLAMGALLTLRGQHAGGIALASGAMAVKASAGLALPFLVLVWAARLPGSRTARIARASVSGIAVFVATFAACSLAAGVGIGWLPALSAPATIIHWYSPATGLGQLAHAVVSLVVDDLRIDPFINFTRMLGGLALLGVAPHLGWAAREGGPDALRRAGVVLLAAAILGPALLSWYPSWGMVLLAMIAWSPRGLRLVAFVSLCLMIVTYPDGGTAQHDLPLLVIGGLLWWLAAESLLRPDPLGLRGWWNTPVRDLVVLVGEHRRG